MPENRDAPGTPTLGDKNPGLLMPKHPDTKVRQQKHPMFAAETYDWKLQITKLDN